MKYLLIILALCFLLIPTLALAQESTAEPTAEVTPNPEPPNPFPEVPPVEDLGTNLIVTLGTIFFAVVATPIGTAIVNALKVIPVFDSLSTETLKFIVGGVLTGVILLARYFGFDGQLGATFDYTYRIIENLLVLWASIKGMTVVHNQAVRRQWPAVLSYKRT